MPIYEYVCKKCGQEVEILHKVDETPNEACEACGSRKLERVVSAAGFRLGGGGWYETDFKSGNKKNVKSDKVESSAACTPTGCEKPGCAAKAA